MAVASVVLGLKLERVRGLAVLVGLAIVSAVTANSFRVSGLSNGL